MNISWHDGLREPQNRANPAFPSGIDLDLSEGAPLTCTADLPYPAKRCGFYLVVCEICRRRIVVTTAGRLDDPRSVKIACMMKGPE